MKGREGDAPLGDAFTARSHPITTLDPSTDQTRTRPTHPTDEHSLPHNTERDMSDTTRTDAEKKGALNKTQVQREQSSDLNDG